MHITPEVLLLVAPAILVTKYVTQFTKFIPEMLISPTNKNHDNVIRLFVILVGVAVVLAMSSLTVGIHSQSGLETNAIVGAAVGLAAINDYHLLDFLKSSSSVVYLEGIAEPLKPLTDTQGLPIQGDPKKTAKPITP